MFAIRAGTAAVVQAGSANCTICVCVSVRMAACNSQAGSMAGRREPDAVMAVLLALCTIIDQPQLFQAVECVLGQAYFAWSPAAVPIDLSGGHHFITCLQAWQHHVCSATCMVASVDLIIQEFALA
jgi:hypothetical protein